MKKNNFIATGIWKISQIQNGKWFCQDFEKKLGYFYDFYLKSDTVFLADVLKKFCKEL